METPLLDFVDELEDLEGPVTCGDRAMNWLSILAPDADLERAVSASDNSVTTGDETRILTRPDLDVSPWTDTELADLPGFMAQQFPALCREIMVCRVTKPVTDPLSLWDAVSLFRNSQNRGRIVCHPSDVDEIVDKNEERFIDPATNSIFGFGVSRNDEVEPGTLWVTDLDPSSVPYGAHVTTDG